MSDLTNMPGEIEGSRGGNASGGCTARQSTASLTLMEGTRNGETAMIFMAMRTSADAEGYAEAATAMEQLAALQPGYRGIESTRGGDGFGITVSFWADEASALAWKHNADHARIREIGRTRWYQRYEIAVAQIGRSYRWSAT